MTLRHYRLPRLTALAAFEAAARHLSFRRAAEELNVTPGAISHQVRALEDDLGVALFERVHRGVELTDQGRAVARVLKTAFLEISDALEAARQEAQDPTVTIAASTAMASFWLMPALTGFWRNRPDIRVNQVVSDQWEPGLNRSDLVISYGALDDPLFTGKPLFRDELVPVCSPQMAGSVDLNSVDALAKMPLVHVEAANLNWPSWKAFFAEQGYTGALRRGVRVNSYVIGLQAAEDGVGMVLGWRRLTAPLLKAGRLVALDRFNLEAPSSFFLSHDRRRADLPAVNALANWLIRQAGASSDEMNSPQAEILGSCP